MKLIIDVDEKLACEGFERPFTDTEVNILLRAIGNGTPYETVTDFADRCKECGKMRKMHTLKKISNECNNCIDCDGCEFYIDHRCCIGGMPETWNLDLIDNHEKGEKNDDMDVVGTEREKYSCGLGLIEKNIKDIESLPCHYSLVERWKQYNLYSKRR